VRKHTHPTWACSTAPDDNNNKFFNMPHAVLHLMTVEITEGTDISTHMQPLTQLPWAASSTALTVWHALQQTTPSGNPLCMHMPEEYPRNSVLLASNAVKLQACLDIIATAPTNAHIIIPGRCCP
jgi:hypothetical protein